MSSSSKSNVPAAPSSTRRKAQQHGVPRGAILNLNDEAAVRHVAACLGHLAAEMFVRGLVADPSAMIPDETPNRRPRESRHLRQILNGKPGRQ